eukprot:CAMPEP_0172490566 /NCGR_PEP_ID=MMETSP1066-20121228/21037_1 /TAXON_ID=671091 /ORGANISM="Coscinodiscus wailesii, Strain CCMP2513" /LENGTH=274 /DNA_ID=CAMNT_0013259095 /DNA_START=101 /DNA_END=925 /DNA_ORIENTATION=-
MSATDRATYQTLPTTETSAAAAPPEPSLRSKLIAEVIGTTVLVQIGCGGLCMNTYIAPSTGIWQCAVIWALGATLAIYATAQVSGAHLNPAVTLSFALVRPNEFSKAKVIPYMAAQLVGGILAGIINLSLFHTAIAKYEGENGIVRGAEGSQASASTFGDYWSDNVGSAAQAFYVEAFGTGFLVFMIFAATRSTNAAVPAAAVPLIVGFSIGMMIALLGGLTGSGINPARDLGPRLVTLFAGWGGVSLQGWWVYVFAPLVGGPIGAAIADMCLV